MNKQSDYRIIFLVIVFLVVYIVVLGRAIGESLVECAEITHDWTIPDERCDEYVHDLMQPHIYNKW